MVAVPDEGGNRPVRIELQRNRSVSGGRLLDYWVSTDIVVVLPAPL